MERDVAAAVDAEQIGAHRPQTLLVDEQIGFAAALAESVHGRMLHQKQRPRLLRRGLIGHILLRRPVAPVGTPRLGGEHAVEERALQRPALGIAHKAQICVQYLHSVSV